MYSAGLNSKNIVNNVGILIDVAFINNSYKDI